MKPMLKTAAVSAALFLTLGGVADAKVIGKGKASGDAAVAAASGTANHPGTLRVRVTASSRQSVTVSWNVTCSKDLGAGTKSGQFKASTPVTRKLQQPMRNPDHCIVAATAQLSRGGTIRVFLLA
jgi:hypothetical protein